MEKRLSESEAMSKRAGEAFEAGRKANVHADSYSLFTVMFSMVMFLARSQQSSFAQIPA
jgi:hypothetical protein